MSASIYGVRCWSRATPQEIKDIIDGPAKVSQYTYDGQKLFEALDARPDPWVPAVEGDANDDSVLVWDADEQPFRVARRKDGEEETLVLHVLWIEDENLPRGVCIIDPPLNVDLKSQFS